MLGWLISLLSLLYYSVPPVLLLSKTLSFTPTPVSLSVSSKFILSPPPPSICVLQPSPSNLLLQPLGPDCLSTGYFSSRLNSSGWNRLNIYFEEGVVGCYAGGLAEGVLMGEVVYEHLRKVREVYSFGDLKELYEYYNRTDGLIVEMLSAKGETPEDEAYLETIRCVRSQLEGLKDGITLTGRSSVTLLDLYLINTDGDIDNLFAVAARISNKPLANYQKRQGRCSALIKLVGSDLFFSHTTMEDFREMSRVLKSYSSPAFSLIMSSYPGSLSSTDDFILTSHGLAIMETSLPVQESVLFPVNTSFPAFMRVQAAARYSLTPHKFISTLLRYDSFTYSSQWMVVDYKKAEERPLNDTFWVLETAPKYSQFGDFSEVLENRTYWSSENWPYFEETVKALGLPAGSRYKGARKKLFKILQEHVFSLEDLQSVMQYNSWLSSSCNSTSLLTPCAPYSAISPRYDLSNNLDWFGGSDSKLTSILLMQSIGLLATSGPTDDSQPAFVFPSWYDRGDLPKSWAFQWIYAQADSNAKT